MLNSFEIFGYKSLVHCKVPIKNLTLLCGLNNSGKSSVIQALRMFCNSYDGKPPLLPGHGSVSELKSKLVAINDTILFNGTFDNGQNSSFALTDYACERPVFAPLSCYISADRWGPKISLPMDQKLNGFPEIGEHGEYVIGFLDKLRNIKIPKELQHPNSQGDVLQYEIVGWLSEIAPGVELFYESHTKQDSTHVEYNNFRPTNVGFGLSYCLPILAAILGMAGHSPSTGWDNNFGQDWEAHKRDRGMLIMIENPEAHLHPKGQTALGRLIALGAASGLQIIVETQSDHLMDGIRIAVKDQLISAEKVIFHYLTKERDGTSKIVTPEINQDGKLSFWPEGFFDQTLKNRTELAR